jgi:glycosidase
MAGGEWRGVSASAPNGWQNTIAFADFGRTSDSCFAVHEYHVHTDFGGESSASPERLHQRGLRLILDFVPNHVAPDHHWVFEHPEFLVAGTEEQLASQPQNYRRLEIAGKRQILAYGRDPYFAGWPDTLQLNYGNQQLQEALFGELRRIAGQCDGVRCDMAMLVLPEIFERTWGIPAAPFWPRATQTIHTSHPGFLFLAEVYWDLEWSLQQQGFDYTYDKRLYDRLVQGQARFVEHLLAGLDFGII